MNRTRAALTVLILLVCTALFHLRTRVEYRSFVWGDAAYYVDLTQSLYDGAPPQTRPTTIHGRRVLASTLTLAILRVEDAVRAPGLDDHPFKIFYDPVNYRRSQPSGPRFQRIRTAWQALDTASFFLIGLSLAALLSRFAPRARAAPFYATLATFALTPTLGRLYVAWPMLDDMTGLAFGLASLYLASTRRVALSGAVLGLAMLARENLLQVYPAFVWVLYRDDQGWRRIAQHAALTFAPYALLAAFPLFSETQAFVDLTTPAAGQGVGAGADYVALLNYHVDQMLHFPSWWLRKFAMHWVTVGPLALTVVAAYPWRDRAALRRDALLWLTLLAVSAAAFRVDRYAVYGLFALLPMASVALESKLPDRAWYAIAAVFFVGTGAHEFTLRGATLQIETTTPEHARMSAITAVLAIAIVAAERAFARRKASA